jgi:hypothetical protein
LPTANARNTTNAAVTVVADGWWALSDSASYYPDDLPADWQLGYFANEHPGAYISAVDWCADAVLLLHEWRDAVPESFRFFLECPPANAPKDLLQQAIAALHGQLGGWVRWTAPGAPGLLLRPTADEAAVWGRAVNCPQTLMADLRAGARWLREQAAAAPATLVILPQPRTAQLAAWRQMQQLLGLAEI